MAPRRHRPQRRHAVPEWLENDGVRGVRGLRLLSTPTAGTVSGHGWGSGVVQREALDWLRERGLDQGHYGRVCERYDAARDAGHPPERALAFALADVGAS